MRVGIIGYGSMGKMLLWKFSEAAKIAKQDLFVSNRTESKLEEAKDIAQVVSNKDLAASSDIVFVCVRPSDLKTVLEEIRGSINPDAMLVSLNGSVSFESIRKVIDIRTAKVIPSLTAEIGRSQTLLCFDERVSAMNERFEKGKKQMAATFEPTASIKSTLIRQQAELIQTLYDESTASEESRKLIQEIERNRDRLKKRGMTV